MKIAVNSNCRDITLKTECKSDYFTLGKIAHRLGKNAFVSAQDSEGQIELRFSWADLVKLLETL